MITHKPFIRRSGFTLIELLAAMSVLVLIVLMMARMFTETTNIWSLGTKRIYESQEGRVVMDFLAKEMTQAIGDGLISFRIHSEPGADSLSVSAYGEQTDSVCFVAPTRTPPYSEMLRACPAFIYYVANMRDDKGVVMPNRYALVRRRKTGSTHTSSTGNDTLPDNAYRRKDWWLPALWSYQPVEVIAENVVGFEVWAYSEQMGDYAYSYDSTQQGDALPLWADIYLEMLDEPNAIRVAELWNANQGAAVDYLERHARRYTTRIYFPNREGYTR